jgi:hypothetical protein
LAFGLFFKVVNQLIDKEFENAKRFADPVVVTESAMGGKKVAIAFCSWEKLPKIFKFFKLYKDTAKS